MEGGNTARLPGGDVDWPDSPATAHDPPPTRSTDADHHASPPSAATAQASQLAVASSWWSTRACGPKRSGRSSYTRPSGRLPMRAGSPRPGSGATGTRSASSAPLRVRCPPAPNAALRSAGDALHAPCCKTLIHPFDARPTPRRCTPTTCHGPRRRSKTSPMRRSGSASRCCTRRAVPGAQGAQDPLPLRITRSSVRAQAAQRDERRLPQAQSTSAASPRGGRPGQRAATRRGGYSGARHVAAARCTPTLWDGTAIQPLVAGPHRCLPGHGLVEGTTQRGIVAISA